MIQGKDLVEFYSPVKVKDGLDLQQLADAAKAMASSNEIPIKVTADTVKSGSLLKSHVEDCLCISHPEHTRDYFTIVIQQNNGQLQVNRYGFSKQMDKKMEKQEAKKGGGTFVKGLLTGHQPEDGYTGNIVGAGIMMKGTAKALFHGIKALGGSKDKLKEEEAWYDAIYAIISSANE